MNSVNIIAIYFITLAYVALGDIIIYRADTEEIIEEFHDLPAQFGGTVPTEGLKVFAIESFPTDGCGKISPAPVKPDDFPLPPAKFVVVIARTNCTFEDKVRNAQTAGYDGAIVFNIGSNELERMSAKNGEDIHIPSVFVGELSGRLIINNYVWKSGYKLLLKEDYPFNINTHLILPFSILVGLCFISMVVYMIYKCAREQRRLRRHRLPKRLLKKIPVIKYNKNQPYESCSICLDDYVEGEKLRVLPCAHAYHCQCIDPWLTKSRRICPLCKRKVFVRGEPRNVRRRNNSSDSMSDSETDDTTPLLNPVENSNHGTFSIGQRNIQGDNANERPTSDDENLLADSSNQSSTGRVNPFNRVPNLPPNLLDELTGRQSIWSRLSRIFRRRPDSPTQLSNTSDSLPITNDITVSVSAAINTSQHPSSNNVLNTNLSGSFKDSDDEENVAQSSIYEPIASPTDANAINQMFVHTPSEGRLGVVALPNVNFNTTATSGADGSRVNGRRRNEDRSFMV
ncbi:unnamed protein product [Hermetia illucens]|uniref:RING-type domain-containing protein n=1 Tax=Hermetia illucens TaxID=343691 RepID=A0A7R8Z2E9_HERIL|nr:E3 ubiquitin-protein ligase RNF13 [Hermetia illucens]XP_037921972.1 E3 ubiquitin-protein ligase RNF13 [Hermetia illucens]CAD7093516.1 unnamed protein product [Hermetia illucens]